MAKGLRKRLTEAADLVAIVGLTSGTVSVRPEETSIQVDALTLVKISKQLDVPRKKIDVDECNHGDRKSFHVSFIARGARWVTVIWADKIGEFYEALGVDPVQRLTAEPLKIDDAGPKRLAAPGPKALELSK